MNTLYQWKARRSGATITIDGVDAKGEATKLRYVRTIEADLPAPIATTVDGDRWLLSLHPCPAGRLASNTPATEAA